MQWIIRRQWLSGRDDFVSSYSAGHKWGHLWTDPASKERFTTACPIGYDTGQYAPPKKFRSLRIAKKLAKRLALYWNRPHFVEKCQS